jgi:hypothetical protein
MEGRGGGEAQGVADQKSLISWLHIVCNQKSKYVGKIQPSR